MQTPVSSRANTPVHGTDRVSSDDADKVIDGFMLKMMDFILNMMDFVLKIMDFVLKIMDFVLEMMGFVLNMMDYAGD